MNNTAFEDLDAHETKVRSAIRRLTLVNFRNYKYLRLNIKAPFIVLSGENGSGKTNVLEAVSFLSQGRGLRNAKLSEVKTFDFLSSKQSTPVFINNNGWAISAQIEKMGEEFNIGTAVESIIKETGYNEIKEVERRSIQINEQKLTSQNELGQYISVVWLTPPMDRLFQGGAQQRRSFLDRIVYAFDADHARRLSTYDNLYRQWLRILKSGNVSTSWLGALEEQMSGIGVAIAAARREQIQKLNLFIEKNTDDVFPEALLYLDGTIEKMLDEKPAVYVEDYYRESLFNQRRSILFNDNSVNFNKTDLCVIYKRKNIPAGLCSTGEQKALLLSIILAQAKSLICSRGIPPIMLLDEVAAHLDDIKKNALLSKLSELRLQAWLTTTNLFEFLEIKNSAQFFEVKNNTIKELVI